MRRGGVALLVLVAVLGVLASCATGSGASFSREAAKERSGHEKSKDSSDDESDDSEADLAVAPPQLTIVVSPSQARIKIDGRVAGTGVVTIDSFGLGQKITISAEAPSYRPKTISVSLWGQTETIALDLEPILGTLDLQGEGLDQATITSPDLSLRPGPNRVLVGEHGLVVRRFGFADQRLRVTVREDETTTLAITFVPVPFAVRGLVNDHPSGFNPDSAALAARTTVRFTVTAPGHALLVLRNRKGVEVGRWNLPRLSTWNQQIEWDGRLDGDAQPDGTYRLNLTAGPEDGSDTVTQTLKIRIDRSRIDRDRTSLGPAPGLLWTPLPEVLSPGVLQASVLTLAHVEDWLVHAPMSASVRVSPATDWELFGQTSLRLWSDEALNSAYATFAVKQRIDVDSPDFRLAWITGATLGGWLDGAAGVPPTDFLSTFPGVRLVVPASWSWGKWTLAVAPEVDASFVSPSTAYETASSAPEGLRFWGYGRFGLSYDPGAFSVGLSGLVRSRTWDRGAGWLAPVQGGLEARLPLPQTPLTLTGYLTTTAYTSVDYAWYAGLGVSALLPTSLTLDLVSQLATSP